MISFKQTDCRLCQGPLQLSIDPILSPLSVHVCLSCNLKQIPRENSNTLDDDANKNSIQQDELRKTSDVDLELGQETTLPYPLSNLAHVIDVDRKRILDTVSSLPLPQGASLIDVGCGYGHISYYISENYPDYNLHLLETSSERLNLGKKVFNTGTDKISLHHRLLDSSFSQEYNQSFDLTFSFHVLEHVYDIRDFVDNLFKITKPGGYILIEVPNDDDDLAENASNYKKILHFPAHVSYFNKQTLEKLFSYNSEQIEEINFIPIQRYGFYNYIDWCRFNDKSKVLSDDYFPRQAISWIENHWLQTKTENFTTDTLMLLVRKK